MHGIEDFSAKKNWVMTVNTVILTGFILRSEQLKNIFADCKIRTELVLTCNISHIVNTQILRIHTMHTKCCKYF